MNDPQTLFLTGCALCVVVWLLTRITGYMDGYNSATTSKEEGWLPLPRKCKITAEVDGE